MDAESLLFEATIPNSGLEALSFNVLECLVWGIQTPRHEVALAAGLSTQQQNAGVHPSRWPHPNQYIRKALDFRPPREELELKNTETNVKKCARLKFSEKLKLHFWVLLNAHLKETPIAGLSE
jgi:hypothetical protein